MILPDLDRGALALEPRKGDQQSRQPHDLAGCEAGNPAEKVHRHGAVGSYAVQRRPVDRQADARLPKRGAEGSRMAVGGRDVDQVRRIHPVRRCRVRKDVRVDRPEHLDRHARRRFDLDLRQLGDLGAKHLQRRLRITGCCCSSRDRGLDRRVHFRRRRVRAFILRRAASPRDSPRPARAVPGAPP